VRTTTTFNLEKVAYAKLTCKSQFPMGSMVALRLAQGFASKFMIGVGAGVIDAGT
jgi:hypothetical protein